MIFIILSVLFLSLENLVGCVVQTEGQESCDGRNRKCDDAAIKHIPLGETWHFHLRGSWSLALLMGEPGTHPTESASFQADLSVTRVNKCQVKVDLRNASLGHQGERANGASTVTVNVDSGSVEGLCMEKGSENNEEYIALSSTIVSALLSNRISGKTFNNEQATSIEKDNFGSCPTRYSIVKDSISEFHVIRQRDLKVCGLGYQPFATEMGRIYWAPSRIDAHVETANWECKQKFTENKLTDVECLHNVITTETSNFTSHFNLQFLKSENGTVNYNPEILVSYKMFPVNGDDKGFDVDNEGKMKNFLKLICKKSKTLLTNDVLLAYPEVSAVLNRLGKDRIVSIYEEAKWGSLCPDNDYFTSLLASMLRDAVSPAAASSKCQLMMQEEVSISNGWASSLVNTLYPTKETLDQCSPLLDKHSWTKTVLGISSLAGNYRNTHCHSRSRDYDSCDLGPEFASIANRLALKVRSCHDPAEEAQKMALWAIKGLKNLDAVGHNTTETLVSCVLSATATREVAVASLQALSKKRCDLKTTEWLQSLIYNETFGAEIRTEAFKSLLGCNHHAARETANRVGRGDIDLRSPQVSSYINGFSTYSNHTPRSWFQLSRTVDVDLSGVFGLANDSRLDGDVVFEDSFIPKSLSLNFLSSLLRPFGGSAQIELRQNNLEDLLQSLLGPGGGQESLQSILEVVVAKVIESLLKPPPPDAKPREKRSLRVEDVTDLLSKIKDSVKGKLEGSLSAGLGNRYRYFTTFSMDPFYNDWEEALQSYLAQIEGKLFATLADFKFKSGISWVLRSEEIIAGTFLGPLLRLRQHEGFVGTLGASSSLHLFSLMKSPFSPSIEVNINPNIAGYWHSSLEFRPGRKNRVFAKVVTPISGGFDVKFHVKPKVEEHFEVTFDIPSTSFHGYRAAISKELISDGGNGAVNYLTDEKLTKDPNMKKYVEEGLQSSLLKNFPMKIEMDFSDCETGLLTDLGLRSCLESTIWKGRQSSFLHSTFKMKKSDQHIDHFRLTISSKNPGSNSLFVSGLLEAVGGMSKREGTIVVGFTYSPHITLKFLMDGGKHSVSFEGTIVNDLNLKRLEARSKFGEDEYGLKAEILMVQDGGQVSIKPRLVMSVPSAREDSLLEGYLAHYKSDKVRSITVDLATDGTLKKLFDVGFQSTAEYRQKAPGDWGLSWRNLHLITPGLDLGIEAALNVKDWKMETNCQVTLDGQVAVMGATLQRSADTATPEQYEAHFHFLSSSKPQLDTKISVVTSIDNGELQNKITLKNGPENNSRDISVVHSTSWRFIYSEGKGVPERVNNLWSTLLQPGRTVILKNKLHVSAESTNWTWKLDHNFQISDHSLENLISLQTDEGLFKIMTNFYDQSREKFQYNMEIEVSFPHWKFTYVDTLLERDEGDIVGQSVTTMPSGRIYTTSTRLKYEKYLEHLLFKLSYDTLIRDGHSSFRISARNTLEYTASQLRFHLSAESSVQLIAIELTVEGLLSKNVDLFFKAFWINILEWEITASSTGLQADVGFSMDLIPYEKHIKSKVSAGRQLSGGGILNGDVVISSTKDTLAAPVSLTLSSSLEIEQPGVYVIKSDVSLMGWGWTAVLRTELAQESNDPQKFTFNILFPDKSRLESESVFLFNFNDEQQNILMKSRIKLPSGIIYELYIGGSSKFHRGSLAEASLEVKVDTPFTEKMFLNAHVRNHLSQELRDFTFYCNTHSDANYWRKLLIDFTWSLDKEKLNAVFDGKFGEKIVSIESFGTYWFDNDTGKIQAFSEIKLPFSKVTEQLKASFDGDLYTSSTPPVIKVSQKSSVQRNFADIFHSEGELLIRIPDAKGRFVVTHTGSRFRHQEYTLEGAFTGQELEISIQGMIDKTPVRVTTHYIDGESLKVFASYGGSSYASLEFMSELEGFAVALREEAAAPKLTTTGLIIWRKRETNFYHVLRVGPHHSSSTLRINSIRGRPMRIHTARTKLSQDVWKTESKMEWGSIKLTYEDEVIFRNIKNFSIKARLDCPAYRLSDIQFQITSSHLDARDQKILIKYSREKVVIHSGSFSIVTSSLEANKPWEISAELNDIVVDSVQYTDLSFKQILALPQSGIQLQSSFRRGETPIAEVSLTAADRERGMFFSLCSADSKCIRLKGTAQSFSKEVPTKNFAVEFNVINSLFREYSDDDVILHSFGLTAENKYSDGEEFRLVAKLGRSVCSEVFCTSSTQVGKHNVFLTVAPNSMDVMYETRHRTMLLKTSYDDDILVNEIPSPKYPFSLPEKTKLLRVKFWFDRVQRPDDVIIWNTTYAYSKNALKFEEFIESVLFHPFIDRPLTVTGLLTTTGNARREAVIDFDVFREKNDAIQLYIKDELIEGIYNLEAHLRDKEPHLSVTAEIVPSPDFGVFDLKIETPFHTANEEEASANIPFRLRVESEINKKETRVRCDMSSRSVKESWTFGYGLPSETLCSGIQLYGDIFERYYRAYGISCKHLLNIMTGISLSADTSNDFAFKFGLKDAKSFEISVFRVIQGAVILRPPFLLQASFRRIGNFSQSFEDVKAAVTDQWRYVVLRSKITMAKFVKDSAVLLKVGADLSRSSQVTDLANVIWFSSSNVMKELQNDELFLDISRGFEASVNISSEILNLALSYAETITGRSFEPLSFYLDRIYHSGSQFWRRFVAAIREELNCFFSGSSRMVNEAVLWVQQKLEYILEESAVGELIRWLQHKVHTYFDGYTWPSIRRLWSTVTYYGKKLLSVAYSGLEETLRDNYNIVIPLPYSVYTLLDIPVILSATSRNELNVVSLREEISLWLRLLLHPEKFLQTLFLPVNAQGVIIGNSMVTFDGESHGLAGSCPHLLFSIRAGDKSTAIALASSRPQKIQSAFDVRRREFLLLAGDDAVQVLPSREIKVNNETVALPFAKNLLRITRDLEKIDVSVTDGENRKYTSLSCQIRRDSCLIDVTGWLQSDVRGLFGTLDYNHYNDYVQPDAVLSPNAAVWEESWQLTNNCSSTEHRSLQSLQVFVDNRNRNFCNNLLLSYSSPVLSCHDTVNIKPYYKICLESLHLLQHSPRVAREVPVVDPSNSNGSEHGTHVNGKGLDEAILPNYLSQFPIMYRSDNSEDKYAMIWANDSSNFQSLNQSLKVMTLDEMETVCNVLTSYRAVCLLHKIPLRHLSFCDPEKNPTDNVQPAPILLDFLVLVEETDCISFINEFLLSPLSKAMTNAFSSSNVDIQIGAIGYGRQSALTFYSRGSSLLTPLSDFQPLNLSFYPQYVEQAREGSLVKAVRVLSKFPFRDGSIRVAFIASCSNQDIPQFTSAMPLEAQRMRLLFYSLTNDPLVHNTEKPKTVRNTIGTDSNYIYHLRRGKVNFSQTYGIVKPTTNMAQLTLQTGGGIFTVTPVKTEKKAEYYMTLFREVFANAIVNGVYTVHSKHIKS